MEPSEQPDKKPRLRKPPLTKREQAERVRSERTKPKRIRKVAGGVGRPLGKIARWSTQEYYLPLPGGRLTDFLNRRRSPVPSYLRQSWGELKLVTWPGRRETWRLTFAVFVFALAFGAVTAVVDKGVESLIKSLILK